MRYHRRFRRGKAIPIGAVLALARQPRCRRCERPLTSPESVRRGIGPCCILEEYDERHTERHTARVQR